MNIQKLILRGLFSLPDSVLYKMGGGPVEIDGNRLDPRMGVLAAQGAKQPSMTAGTPEQAREGAAKGFELLDGPVRPTVSVEDRTIPGPGGSLAVRVYRHGALDRQVPILVYYHMGGCVIGDLETCHTFCSIIAEIADCIVVSVDYRLAPEHKFPAAVEDAVAAYRWVTENAAALGGLSDKVGVGGDSAGGYLSAVVAQEMKRSGGPMPHLQLLIYPVSDMTAKGGSMESCGQCYPLTAEIMDWFIRHYLNDPSEADDVRASPLKDPDLSGLSPAIVVTAGFDPLRDQGAAYAEALRAAGNQVVYRCYGSLAHAFTAMSGTVPAAKAACEEIAEDVLAGFAASPKAPAPSATESADPHPV